MLELLSPCGVPCLPFYSHKGRWGFYICKYGHLLLDAQGNHGIGTVEIGRHVLAVLAAAWLSLLVVSPSPVWIVAIESEVLCSVLQQ